MNAAHQANVASLLELAGAIPSRHGKGKWTCPACKRPTLSVNPDKGVFHCFHGGCTFQGGIGTLRKWLGLRREWLPRAEYLRLRRQQQQARAAAQRLAQVVRERRAQLLEELRTLGRAELMAHNAGPHDAAAWEALFRIYAQRPAIEADLTALEEGNAAKAFQVMEGAAR